jgi:hypothetical protein
LGKSKISKDEKVRRLNIWSQSFNQTALHNTAKADASNHTGNCTKQSHKKGIRLLPYTIPVEMLQRRLSISSLKVRQLIRNIDSPLAFKG